MSQNKSVIISLIVCLLLGAVFFVSAQENEPILSVLLEEEIDGELIEPEDLDIEEPVLLPDSPFYFLKEWGRGIQSFFAFGKIKKTELEQKFANERLMELKKLSEKTRNTKIIEKATEKYKKSIEKVRSRVEEIKEKAEENEKVKSFLEKFTQHQILHQKILEKLEEQVPEQAFEKIKEAREEHLKKFEEVMNKLEEREEKIEEIKEEAQEKIKERIKIRVKEQECKILWWYDNKNKECQQKRFCGMFMYNGLRTFETEEECQKNLKEQSQSTQPELGACITLWDPVCGKDGKTYSNECFAEQAGVETKHKGECQTRNIMDVFNIFEKVSPEKNQKVQQLIEPEASE